MPDDTWMDYAACKDLDPDLFFPSQSQVAAARNRHELLPAQRICQSCLYQYTCLNYAVEHGLDYGIWGGLLERERVRIRRSLPRSARALP
jgi:WhiB family transcriptional regulator, redox-sensing transcriptional regulator